MEEETTLESWRISEADFPHQGGLRDKLMFAVRYAILAPSIYNTQPWHFRVLDTGIELFADKSRLLPVADPLARELILSCGAALLHLRLALQYFGLGGGYTLFPDPQQPDLLARLTLQNGKEPSEEEKLLFQTIPKRHTSRLLFSDRALLPSLLTALQQNAAQEGAWLSLIQERERREEIIRLVEEGHRLHWADEKFRNEMSTWLSANRNLSPEGMPSYTLGARSITAYAGPLMTRALDWGDLQAEADRRLIEEAPLLVVLGTKEDTPRDWVVAGQAMERVFLRARAEGVWSSPFSQPTEVPALRERLRKIVGVEHVPQLVFRLGYGPEVKPSPRRPLRDVLLL